MNLNWQRIPTIRAQRLTLRPFEDTDVEPLYRIYSDEEVMRYWGGGTFRQFSEAKDFLTEVKEDLKQRRCLQWAIVRQEDDELVGTFAIFHWDLVAQKCEIGFVLGRAYWRMGYMSEAVQVALAFAFDHLDIRRVEADVDPRNRASVRLLERLGFKKECYLRERWLVLAETQDSVIYGLLKKEWNDTEITLFSRFPYAVLVRGPNFQQPMVPSQARRSKSSYFACHSP
jgi:ribosomal-protein-alanine N-acetyltransferase